MREIITLAAFIVFTLPAEEAATDPLAKLPKKVADTWREKYADAKVIAIDESGKKEFRIKASDEHNKEFSISLAQDGTLIEQTTRKIATEQVPVIIGERMQSFPVDWKNEQAYTGKARDERFVYLLRIYKQFPLIFWYTEDGDMLWVQRIRNPEERKIAEAAEADVREPAPRNIAVSLNKDGQIVFEGQEYGDVAFQSKLDEKYGKKRLNVTLVVDAALQERKDAVIAILRKRFLKDLSVVPAKAETK
jgi:hypothetical protein